MRRSTPSPLACCKCPADRQGPCSHSTGGGPAQLGQLMWMQHSDWRGVSASAGSSGGGSSGGGASSSRQQAAPAGSTSRQRQPGQREYMHGRCGRTRGRIRAVEAFPIVFCLGAGLILDPLRLQRVHPRGRGPIVGSGPPPAGGSWLFLQAVLSSRLSVHPPGWL